MLTSAITHPLFWTMGKSPFERKDNRLAKKTTMTYEQKMALLESGQPFIVQPREVEKVFKDTLTSPEVILGCIIVSGTLDTSVILETEILLAHNMALTDEQHKSHQDFMRVLENPTEEEKESVFDWARKIMLNSPPRKLRLMNWNTSQGFIFEP